MTSFTRKNLTEVEDSAPKFGDEELMEARFATGDLDAAETGVSLERVKPGKPRHEKDGEIFPGWWAD